jgi:hypothetical protein
LIHEPFLSTVSIALRIPTLLQNVEEPQGLKKQAPARGGTGAKRTRTAEVHNLSERVSNANIKKHQFPPPSLSPSQPHTHAQSRR